ncbi:MAG: hypothetical protein AAF542_18035 [Pseudomonadota bacterium]
MFLNDEQFKEFMSATFDIPMPRDEWADMIGKPDSTVRGWQEKHWTYGDQYIVVGHQTMVIKGRANKWLINYGTSANKTDGSESESNERESPTSTPLKVVSQIQ